MKVGFIGCVEFSRAALELLVSMQDEDIEVCCVMTKAESKFNSDHVDLSEVCKKEAIAYHFDLGNQQENLAFFSRHQPDVIYCFGWSYLLKVDLLSMAPKGVVGFHPAALPKNRGRHPLIWALALGLTETASSFFLMDEGADSGPLISQKPIKIEQVDDASSLYHKMTKVALEQIEAFTLAFRNNEVKPVVQNAELASYWRKRSRVDGKIDWRMPAEDIYNLVRALAKPYPGAEFQVNDELYTLWKAQIFDGAVAKNHECGKVLALDNGKVLVKCAGTSAIWIEECTYDGQLKPGDYL